jgi:hypothetical protein
VATPTYSKAKVESTPASGHTRRSVPVFRGFEDLAATSL